MFKVEAETGDPLTHQKVVLTAKAFGGKMIRNRHDNAEFSFETQREASDFVQALAYDGVYADEPVRVLENSVMKQTILIKRSDLKKIIRDMARNALREGPDLDTLNQAVTSGASAAIQAIIKVLGPGAISKEDKYEYWQDIMSHLDPVVREMMRGDVVIEQARGSLYANVTPEDLRAFMMSPEFIEAVPYYFRDGALYGEPYTYGFKRDAEKWIEDNVSKFGTSWEAESAFKDWAKDQIR